MFAAMEKIIKKSTMRVVFRTGHARGMRFEFGLFHQVKSRFLCF